MEHQKKRFLDDPANVDRLWRGFVVACVAVAALDLLGLLDVLWHRHVSLFVEGLPGFYPLWGFLGISIFFTLSRFMAYADRIGEGDFSPIAPVR